MRIALLILLSALIGRSCDSGLDLMTESGNVVTTLALADTNGLPQTTFHFGESFDFTFGITNLTQHAQTYHHTGPTVRFEIVQGDSILATSVDGLAWIQVVLEGSIPLGGSESATWRGPKPLGGNPYFKLYPGQYSARAKLGYYFEAVRPAAPPPVTFVVVP